MDIKNGLRRAQPLLTLNLILWKKSLYKSIASFLIYQNKCLFYTLLKEDSAMYFNRFDKLEVPKNTNYKNNTDHATTQRQHKKSLRMAGVYEYKTYDPDTLTQDPMYLILRPTGELITIQRHRANRWGKWLCTSSRTIQFTMRFERDTSLILNNRTVHVVNKNVLQLNQPDSIVFTRVKTRLF